MTVDYGTNQSLDHWVRYDPVTQEHVEQERLPEISKNLDRIAEGLQVIRSEDDNYLDIDSSSGAGEVASTIINSVINKSKEKRSAEQKKRQALKVSLSYIERAKDGLDRVKKDMAILRELHNSIIDVESEGIARLLLDGSGASDRLEAVGFFAMELDRHFDMDSKDEKSYVSALNNALDNNDGTMLRKFISAARANTAQRKDAYMLQKKEFEYFLTGLKGGKPKDYKAELSYRRGTKQDPYVQNRIYQDGGPGRIDKN